jgi:hypothetical protein
MFIDDACAARVLVFVFCFLFFVFCYAAALFVVVFALSLHPRGRAGAHTMPLSGAGLTFFAAAKKVSKESGLTPPILAMSRWCAAPRCACFF